MYSSGITVKPDATNLSKKLRRLSIKYLDKAGLTSNKNQSKYANKSCDTSKLNNTKITINVSGKKFELKESLIECYPLTLLANNKEAYKYYDRLANEYFFDRNREAFEGIIFFYQTNGRFELPQFVSIDVFYQELKFFGLHNYLNNDSKCEDSILQTALEEEYNELKRRQTNADENQEEIKQEKIALKNRFKRIDYYFDEEDEFLHDENKNVPKNKFQRRLWDLLEKPQNSLAGRLIASIFLLTVLLSVTLICIESLYFNESPPQSTNSTFKNCTKSSVECQNDKIKKNYRRYEFFILELIFNFIFIIEFVLKFIAAPKKCKFMISFANLIDLLAILPFWITLFLNNSNLIYSKLSGNELQLDQDQGNNQYGLSILRVLRLVRFLRVLKLTRYVRALNIMGKIIKECSYEIITLMTCLAINIVIFSSLIYYIELFALGEMSPFLSIPHSFWWAVISFTTVGYGDLVPMSNYGKLFGSFFILIGILIALLPVPILSCKFEKIYQEFSLENQKQDKKDAAEEEKKKKT